MAFQTSLNSQEQSDAELVCSLRDLMPRTAYTLDKDALNIEYNNNLYAESCNMKKQECALLTPSDAYYPFTNGVVGVTSTFNIDTDGQEATFNNFASGFLIRPKEYVKNYEDCDYVVVTTARSVIYTGDGTRVPPPPADILPYVEANNITIQVNNVNGTQESHVYEMEILIVDLQSNVALLGFKEFPSIPVGPQLTDHVYFMWGESRRYPVGQQAFILLPKNIPLTNGIIPAIVSNNHYNPLDTLSTTEKYESVLLSNGASVFSNGAPIISIIPDCQKRAQVIGICTYNDSYPNITVGISQLFAQRVVDAYLAGINGNLNGHLINGELQDGGVSFYRYMKGYYGLNLRLYEAADALNIPGLKYTNITGYIVVGVDTISPFFGTLNVNDLLVSVNDMPLGSDAPKITPLVISHFSIPGQPLMIKYRKFSAGFEKCECFNRSFLALPLDRTISDYI